jgi:hypothetical protein
MCPDSRIEVHDTIIRGQPLPIYRSASTAAPPIDSVFMQNQYFFFFFFKISPSAVELARLLIDYTYLTYFARLCCAIGENAHCVAT